MARLGRAGQESRRGVHGESCTKASNPKGLAGRRLGLKGAAWFPAEEVEGAARITSSRQFAMEPWWGCQESSGIAIGFERERFKAWPISCG